MKKFLFLIICIIAVNANAQERKLDLEKFGCSFLIGATNQFDSPSMLTYGFQLTVYNVYLDLTFKSAYHSNDVKIDKWSNEKKNTNFHIGYRVGKKGFGLTPVVGTSNYKIGTVDGSNYSVSSSGIHNHFETKESKTRFDYGAVLDYHFKTKSICGFKIQAEITRYNITGGVGMYF